MVRDIKYTFGFAAEKRSPRAISSYSFRRQVDYDLPEHEHDGAENRGIQKGCALSFASTTVMTALP